MAVPRGNIQLRMLVVSAKASRTGRCRPDDVRAAARAEPRPTGSSCRMTFRAAARAEPRPAGRGEPRLGRSLALPGRFWREEHVPHRPHDDTQFKD
jgi:hypothetical protein